MALANRCYLSRSCSSRNGIAHELIKSLPNGYHTIIGDKQNLSQGQKQLICIAGVRIISDAKIIILDERQVQLILQQN